MSFLRVRSIAARLTQMSVLVSGTALLLAYVSFFAYDIFTLRQNLISSLDAESQIIGDNSVTALLFDDQDAARSTLSALRGSPHVLYAIIYEPDGKPFAEYSSSGSPRSIEPFLRGEQQFGHMNRDGVVIFGRRIVSGNRTIGSVYLAAETADVAYRAKQFGAISACILILCFVASLLVTSSIRHLITGPLTNLAQTAQRVTRDRDYSVRAAPARTGDEVSLLVQSFNEMLEQIQTRDRALEAARAELEQKVAERTAELRAANEELKAFSYTVAHDLRGPLEQQINIGYMLQQRESGVGNGSPDLVAIMLEGCRRMSRLIDDLLNLSRAASAPLNRTGIDLSAMAESIFQSLCSKESDREVSFVVAQGAMARADEGLMAIVMQNLMANAWKYTSRLKSAKIEFGYERSSGETVYFVRDNGAGFDPSYADRLFRPFQRLHSQGDFPGTGVGLATVQRIVARHGGRVWAEGDVNKGATFFFTLPDVAPGYGQAPGSGNSSLTT